MLRIQRTNIAPILVLIFMLLMGAQAQADSPQQEITIQDDFSSSGDWNLTEGFAIQGGVLELTISEAGETYSLPLPDNTEYRNFAMAIDIASEQDGDYTYHLWFRAAGEGSGYAFSITPSRGLYTVETWEDGTRSDLIVDSTSEAINRQGGNRIGVIGAGDELYFYINGNEVVTFTDETYENGQILLGATTSDPADVPLLLTFDNLTVSPNADQAVIDEQVTEDTPIADTPQDQHIVFNVPIGRGGIEIFPQPDRASGRLHAATGIFEPHVAGRDESGDWLFIYYFDGGWQEGWSRASQLTIDEGDLADLAVIDPQNPPDLPDLEFSETAVLPFGVGAPSAAASEPEQPDTSAPSNPPPADAAPSTGGGDHPPVIHSAQLTGTCQNLTMTMAWSDEDGDAIRFEHRGSPGGGPIDGLTQSFSGSGSTHVVPNLYCDGASCGGYLVIIDAAGNQSRPVLITVDC